MSLKFKINSRKIINFSYIVIVVSNLILLFLLVKFIKEQVYSTYFVDEEYLQSQKLKAESDLNIDKFNEVIGKIEDKQRPKELSDIKNVF